MLVWHFFNLSDIYLIMLDTWWNTFLMYPVDKILIHVEIYWSHDLRAQPTHLDIPWDMVTLIKNVQC